MVNQVIQLLANLKAQPSGRSTSANGGLILLGGCVLFASAAGVLYVTLRGTSRSAFAGWRNCRAARGCAWLAVAKTAEAKGQLKCTSRVPARRPEDRAALARLGPHRRRPSPPRPSAPSCSTRRSSPPASSVRPLPRRFQSELDAAARPGCGTGPAAVWVITAVAPERRRDSGATLFTRSR